MQTDKECNLIERKMYPWQSLFLSFATWQRFQLWFSQAFFYPRVEVFFFLFEKIGIGRDFQFYSFFFFLLHTIIAIFNKESSWDGREWEKIGIDIKEGKKKSLIDHPHYKALIVSQPSLSMCLSFSLFNHWIHFLMLFISWTIESFWLPFKKLQTYKEFHFFFHDFFFFPSISREIRLGWKKKWEREKCVCESSKSFNINQCHLLLKPQYTLRIVGRLFNRSLGFKCYKRQSKILIPLLISFNNSNLIKASCFCVSSIYRIELF